METFITTLYTTTCNLCNASDESFVTIQNSYRIVRCNRCGFVYVNPRPDNETLKRLYLTYLPEKIEDPLAWASYMKGVFSRAARLIGKKCPGKGRMLDIGCGYGFFLQQMKKRGWHASGLDISDTAVSYAKKAGVDAAAGTLETVRYKDNSFDAITMFYVLEHLPDPLASLAEVKRILKPGGVLLVRVPHTTPIVSLLSAFGIRNNLYDPPFHLNDFSAPTLRALLEKAGFRIVNACIGGYTNPPGMAKKIITLMFGLIAEGCYVLSFGKFILPGVAHTALAIKND